jgi:hypothetical protein
MTTTIEDGVQCDGAAVGIPFSYGGRQETPHWIKVERFKALDLSFMREVIAAA